MSLFSKMYKKAAKMCDVLPKYDETCNNMLVIPLRQN